MANHCLNARITETGSIACILETSGPELVAPVICFSLMAPGTDVGGGDIVETCGSFHAVRLRGTLTPDRPLGFEIRNAQFPAANRAWLPLGVYLRLPDGTTEPVEGELQGAKSGKPRATITVDGLGLVPVPGHWAADGTSAVFTGLRELPDGLEVIDGLGERTGLGPLTTPDGWDVSTEIDASLGPDGYCLTLTDGHATVAAGGRNGVRHALITLLTLRTTHGGIVPLGVIRDTPRFEWRGQHLDCARHFYSVDAILRLLDLMALLKLNRFHWHFADDEAFRLEVECYPDLWRKSAFRGEGQTVPGVFGGGAGPTGGTYSKQDAAYVVAHAAELGIEVMPEIEFPAHALAIARIFPELTDPNDSGSETSVQGYLRNVVCPAKPETEEFFETLADEVAGLFPFAHLHLGGDELPEHTWEGSPLVDGLKTRAGLSNKEDVQGWAMERLARKLAAQGIAACAWEESMMGSQGGIGNDAILFSWKGQTAGVEAARRGHRVVMCPAQHVYFDMAHTAGPDDWGANWAAYVSLSDTIAWDPVPKNEPELERLMLGVEGAFWSEFTTEDRQLEPMLAPRILGLSVMAWSARNSVTSNQLETLARIYEPFFAAMNWTVSA